MRNPAIVASAPGYALALAYTSGKNIAIIRNIMDAIDPEMPTAVIVLDGVFIVLLQLSQESTDP